MSMESRFHAIYEGQGMVLIEAMACGTPGNRIAPALLGGSREAPLPGT